MSIADSQTQTSNNRLVHVLDVPVLNATPLEAAQRFIECLTADTPILCCANAHTVVTSRSHTALCDAMNRAAVVIPDGKPIAIAMQLLSGTDQARVDGPTLMLDVCKIAANQGIKVFLLGGSPETLRKLEAMLKQRFSTLQIAATWSPPFAPLSDGLVADGAKRITASRAQIVFVGLGAPKQEEWMLRSTKLTDGVAYAGVGAAFDFHAGTIKRAPQWMQRFGLEWLYRLSQDPRRLWKRYLVTNTKFAILFAQQYLRHRRRTRA